MEVPFFSYDSLVRNSKIVPKKELHCRAWVEDVLKKP